MAMKIEWELEHEARSLDSKKLVFISSYIIPTHPALDFYIRFEKENSMVAEWRLKRDENGSSSSMY